MAPINLLLLLSLALGHSLATLTASDLDQEKSNSDLALTHSETLQKQPQQHLFGQSAILTSDHVDTVTSLDIATANLDMPFVVLATNVADLSSQHDSTTDSISSSILTASKPLAWRRQDESGSTTCTTSSVLTSFSASSVPTSTQSKATQTTSNDPVFVAPSTKPSSQASLSNDVSSLLAIYAFSVISLLLC